MSVQCPGLMECSLLYARTLFLAGSLDAAQRKAADVLRSNADEYNAHLLICSVYVAQEKPDLALSALDQAVSANFAVRGRYPLAGLLRLSPGHATLIGAHITRTH